jgi:oligoendopeptidase F
MEHKKDIPLRSELRLEDTWNLTPIYSDDAAWEADFVEVDGKAPKAADFQGRLGESAQVLLDAIKFQEEVFYKVGLLYVYAHLNFDTDTTNAHYQAMFSRIESLYAKIGAAFSFFRSELMEIDEAKIWGFVDQKEELKIYKHEFEQMFAKRAYILSEKEERILAQGSEVFSAPSTIFGMLNNADLKLPMVKGEDGEESQLSHGRYVLFLESRVRDVRRGAFMGMYHTYRDLKNTFAATLSSMIKAHNFNASIRGYSSARHAALFANAIPESVYDSLVEAVNSRLDLMHRYVDLRKKVLKLDDIAMYDLYTPLVEEIDVKFTYDDAKSLILEGLSVLGEEYQAILKEAFESRWIDVFENKGKRSGAYSSGTYGTSPYILMNWQDNIDNVFTLAHELGHSVHSYMTRKYQPFVYGDYSIFLAEVASTTNEILLTDFMLKKFDDPKIKAYLINHYLDGFKGTVFRQTQFAQFEHLIHDAQQNGTALTAEFLTKNYFDINKKYYGEQMTYDEEIGFEWARIPHFYYNYYVYQYATGFSAASALSAKILNEGPMAIEAYLNYLKSGSSDVPIEVLKKAGVDMTSNQATKDALRRI